MTENIWIQLGLAAPLVGILLYLLKQSNEERKEMTTKFIAALQEIVTESNSSRIYYAAQLGDVASTLRGIEERNTQEHKDMIDAISKLSLRTEK